MHTSEYNSARDLPYSKEHLCVHITGYSRDSYISSEPFFDIMKLASFQIAVRTIGFLILTHFLGVL
jgi:hypothetical protein